MNVIIDIRLLIVNYLLLKKQETNNSLIRISIIENFINRGNDGKTVIS